MHSDEYKRRLERVDYWANKLGIEIIDRDAVAQSFDELYLDDLERSAITVVFTVAFGLILNAESTNDPRVWFPSNVMAGIISGIKTEPVAYYNIEKLYKDGMHVLLQYGRISVSTYNEAITTNFDAIMEIAGRFLEFEMFAKPNTGYASVDKALKMQLH